MKHGMYKYPEYWAWLAMKQRCTNPKNPYFRYYGQRGITVYQPWLESFTNFFADMGKRPSPKHSLERIDNDKGYYPDNCTWIVRNLQTSNTRRTIRVTIDGKTLCLKAWCRILGKSPKFYKHLMLHKKELDLVQELTNGNHI